MIDNTDSKKPFDVIVTSIQDEWERETGERPHSDIAEIILDRMCDAFVHKLGGAGAEYAVRDDMRTAEYLATVWDGDSGERLRAAIATVNAEPPAPERPRRSSVEMQDRYWCAACCISVSVHAKTEADQATHKEACGLLQDQVEAMPMLPFAEELPYPMNWQAWVAYVRECDSVQALGTRFTAEEVKGAPVVVDHQHPSGVPFIVELPASMAEAVARAVEVTRRPIHPMANYTCGGITGHSTGCDRSTCQSINRNGSRPLRSTAVDD